MAKTDSDIEACKYYKSFKVANLIFNIFISEKKMFREDLMLARAKEKVLSAAVWLDVREITRLSGLNQQEFQHQLNVWKINERVFSVYHNDIEIFPMYAFDPSNRWHPNGNLSLVIHSFKPWKTEWAIAIWLAGANGFLGGRRPQDLLTQNIGVLKAAIIDELAGITHG